MGKSDSEPYLDDSDEDDKFKLSWIGSSTNLGALAGGLLGGLSSFIFFERLFNYIPCLFFRYISQLSWNEKKLNWSGHSFRCWMGLHIVLNFNYICNLQINVPFFRFTKGVPLMIVGRVLTGFGAGVACGQSTFNFHFYQIKKINVSFLKGVAPAYVNHISTPNIRGLLGTGFQVRNICFKSILKLCKNLDFRQYWDLIY